MIISITLLLKHLQRYDMYINHIIRFVGRQFQFKLRIDENIPSYVLKHLALISNKHRIIYK